MASNVVSEYPPGDPSVGDFWTSTSEQGGGQLFVWNGTYWRSDATNRSEKV